MFSLTIPLPLCSVEFDNAVDQSATVITVGSANRYGCLLAMVQLLTDLNLVISKAFVSSDGGWFVDGAYPCVSFWTTT